MDESDLSVLEVDNLDEELLLCCEEDLTCTCGSVRARKIDCLMNTRHKTLFLPTANFKPGEKVPLHIPTFA